MTAEQRQRIEQHGRNLLAIFPGATERDPVNLCRKLRRLERQGNAIGLRMCNGPEYAEGEDDAATDAVLVKVNAILGNVDGPVPVFVNRDPRGYALKIDDSWMKANRPTLHSDWGGYGIIAPDLTN